MSVSKYSQELRDFTDALRVALGKDPLYRQVHSVYHHETVLPASSLKTDEWFQAAAVAHEAERGVDKSVELAMRARTSGGHKPQVRSRRKGEWQPQLAHDTSVRSDVCSPGMQPLFRKET